MMMRLETANRRRRQRRQQRALESSAAGNTNIAADENRVWCVCVGDRIAGERVRVLFCIGSSYVWIPYMDSL